MLWSKKVAHCTRAILVGAEKNKTRRRKNKIEGVAYISKNGLNHTSGAQEAFISNSYFETAVPCPKQVRVNQGKNYIKL